VEELDEDRSALVLSKRMGVAHAMRVLAGGSVPTTQAPELS
jgi:hypothetical protein